MGRAEKERRAGQRSRPGTARGAPAVMSARVTLVEKDGAHAFYLGTELAKAEIAFRLAKRYAQDEPLDWGVAADAPVEDATALKAPGHTLIAKKKREAS